MIRETLTWIVLVTTTAISVAACVQVARSSLPDEAALELSDLRQWLLARDLSKATQRQRREIVQELEANFSQGGDWPVELELLHDERLERFTDNVAVLMREWLLEKTETWESIDEQDRDAYVDEQIDAILRWRVVMAVDDLGAATSTLHEALGSKQDRDIRMAWMGYFTPEERQRIRPFLMAVFQRAPARAIQQMQSRWPGGD